MPNQLVCGDLRYWTKTEEEAALELSNVPPVNGLKKLYACAVKLTLPAPLSTAGGSIPMVVV